MRRASVLAVALAALPAPSLAGDFDSPGSVLGRLRSTPSEAPDIQGVPLSPSDMPAAGHGAQFPPSAYNIWALNCHSEANMFAAHAEARGLEGGILACKGDPEKSPAFHTANWINTGGGRTCIVNYGQQCCFSGGGSPPEIGSGMAKQCAQWACGSQYDPAETRALERGKLVESPGAHACAVEVAGGPVTLMRGPAIQALVERSKTGSDTVRVPPSTGHPDEIVLTFSPDRLDPCLKCCDTRAGMWSGAEGASVTKNLASGREDQFRRQCLSACRTAFAPKP